MSRLHKPLNNTDHVTVLSKELPFIPVGANPFNHDAGHMGTELVRGWVAMHAGYDNAESPIPLNYLILVNTRTGQRLQLDFEPSVQTLRDAVAILSDDDVDDEPGMIFTLMESPLDNALVDRSVPLNKAHGSFHKSYVRVGDCALRMNVFLDLEKAKVAYEEAMFAELPIPEWQLLYTVVLNKYNTHVQVIRQSTEHKAYEPFRVFGYTYTPGSPLV